MCIVCGDGPHLLRALVARHAPRPRTRLVASAVAQTHPPLDPAASGLDGPADVILRGGPIVPMSGASDAAAIAVRAGRIQAVGDEAAVLAHRGRLTRVIDLRGQVLLPGFVNAHWHMPFSLLCEWVDATEQVPATPEFVVMTIDPAQPAPRLPSGTNIVLADRDGRIFGGTVPDLPAHLSGLLPRFAARLAVSTDPIRVRLLRLFDQSAAAGITCLRVCGLGTLNGAGDLTLMRDAMQDAPRLRLRATLDADLLPEWSDLQLRPGFGDDFFRVDTVSAWSAGPDLDAAHRAGWHLLLHAADDAQAQAALPHLAPGDGIECRTVPSPNLLTEMAGGQISFGLTGGYARLPLAGIPISLGLDTIAGPSKPLDMLRDAVAAGMPPAQALAALTIDAAKRCGTDTILGSLERGKYADFVLLDRDPRTDPQAICTATWLNGLDVYRAPLNPSPPPRGQQSAA